MATALAGHAGLEFQRRPHACWHVGANNLPEAEARKEPFRSGGQEVNGRRSSLPSKVQSGADDLMSEAESLQRFVHGNRSKQRSIRVELQGCACHNAIVEP